jgi:hypothetical protein
VVRTGDEMPDAIKKLLGEENNLKAAVLTYNFTCNYTSNEQKINGSYCCIRY